MNSEKTSFYIIKDKIKTNDLKTGNKRGLNIKYKSEVFFNSDKKIIKLKNGTAISYNWEKNNIKN
jgi:hypothetical protein